MTETHRSGQPVEGENVGDEETCFFRKKELDALDGQTDDNPAQVSEKEIDGMTVITASKAMKVLKKAPKKGKGKESAPVSIADQTIENPLQAYRNFKEALALVKRALPPFLRVEVESIRFQKLAGDVVGKSSEDGEIIDPVMLLHPVMRLATVLYHEICHNRNRVPNEGLVHSYTELFFGSIDATDKYNQLGDKLIKFAEIYGKGRITNGAKEIYKLYYQASQNANPQYYKKMRETFLKRARKGKHFADEIAAAKFFEEVFPELEISGGLKRPGESPKEDSLPLAA